MDNFTNEEILNVINNVQISVKGEKSMIEKLNPYLQSMTLWTNRHIAPDDLFNAKIRRFIILKAFCFAIPSLDLVLTPNGFATVGNNNLVPVSKERITRLIQATEKAACFELDQAIFMLRTEKKWLLSDNADFFKATLIPQPSELCNIADIPLTWDNYMTLRRKIAMFELNAATEYISNQIYDDLKEQNLALSLSRDCKSLVKILVDADANEILNLYPREFLLLKAVEFIRQHPLDSTLANWTESQAAKNFIKQQSPNSKNSSAYFF
jgi:hypothetical protein